MPPCPKYVSRHQVAIADLKLLIPLPPPLTGWFVLQFLFAGWEWRGELWPGNSAPRKAGLGNLGMDVSLRYGEKAKVHISGFRWEWLRYGSMQSDPRT